MIILQLALPVCALITNPGHRYIDTLPGIAVIAGFEGFCACYVEEGCGVGMQTECMVPGYSVAHFVCSFRLAWVGWG